MSVVTDLNVTGKPAQFGRGVMAEVAGKLVGQFADCLAAQLGSDGGRARGDAGGRRDRGAGGEADTATPSAAPPLGRRDGSRGRPPTRST